MKSTQRHHAFNSECILPSRSTTSKPKMPINRGEHAPITTMQGPSNPHHRRLQRHQQLQLHRLQQGRRVVSAAHGLLLERRLRPGFVPPPPELGFLQKESGGATAGERESERWGKGFLTRGSIRRGVGVTCRGVTWRRKLTWTCDSVKTSEKQRKTGSGGHVTGFQTSGTPYSWF